MNLYDRDWAKQDKRASRKRELIWKLIASDNPESFANKLRSARFRQFEAMVSRLPRPIKILDVGGRAAFWENRGWAGRADVEIFSLNLVREEERHKNVKSLVGDATNLIEFRDGSFDIAFSNSVIEHLFTFENQRRMAAEMQRVGKAFWVQTPNFWFPVEPHFLLPGWQWMPLCMRVSLVRRWRCGWAGPFREVAAARNAVEEIRLLKKAELEAIFPNATLIPERFGGLVKSWTVVGGF
jgi:SAM-dependent methyltransferase